MTAQSESFHQYNEPIGEHYSNKGGHWERHKFHEQLRKGMINPQGLPIENQRVNRRKMFRDPRSGR